MGPIRYAVREPVELATLQGLFRDSWESGEKQDYDRVLERSFTWLTAHDGDDLVGFVNVAWDGGVHLFLLDTTVAPSHRGRGMGRELVRRTVAACPHRHRPRRQPRATDRALSTAQSRQLPDGRRVPRSPAPRDYWAPARC